jgi:hypothetical protein
MARPAILNNKLRHLCNDDVIPVQQPWSAQPVRLTARYGPITRACA